MTLYLAEICSNLQALFFRTLILTLLIYFKLFINPRLRKGVRILEHKPLNLTWKYLPYDPALVLLKSNKQ